MLSMWALIAGPTLIVTLFVGVMSRTQVRREVVSSNSADITLTTPPHVGSGVRDQLIDDPEDLVPAIAGMP